MIVRLRESLALALIALLPLHALLVTVGTKLLIGPGHAPLSTIVLWKEGVLSVILLLACLEIVLLAREKNSETRLQWGHLFRCDRIDWCVLIGILYATVQFSIFRLPSSIQAFVFGFKYDFVPLAFFLILRRVPWSSWFKEKVALVLLGVGVIVSVYGIVSILLPLSFFTWLGYSDLHSLYQANGPVAAFQQIGSSSLRRIQSTMSGPNQFGIWLLIPLGIALTKIAQERMTGGRLLRVGTLFGVLSLALVLTFSRSAWVGAALMVAATLWMTPYITRRAKIRWTAGAGVSLVSCGIILTLLYPSLILRLQSSSDHLRKPVEAIKLMVTHPFGLGLGTAGPASNRSSDTCVMQDAGTDASWAVDRPNLCIFVGGVQVQPATRACSCPLLTENWYLQWGVEMGVLGLVLSVMLAFFIVTSEKRKVKSDTWIFITFLGISLCALFLHAWEDAAVAYSVWLLLAAICED